MTITCENVSYSLFSKVRMQPGLSYYNMNYFMLHFCNVKINSSLYLRCCVGFGFFYPFRLCDLVMVQKDEENRFLPTNPWFRYWDGQENLWVWSSHKESSGLKHKCVCFCHRVWNEWYTFRVNLWNSWGEKQNVCIREGLWQSQRRQ